MQDMLAQLNRVRGVGGSLLVSGEGLPMASLLRQGTDENALGAAVGDLVGSAQRLTGTLGLGILNSFTAGSEQGTLLVLGAGPAFMVILVDPSANLALLQLEVRSVVDRIAQRLSL